jgi:hypothetical protein
MMRERTFKARREKLLAEEATEPESWWWLSFAGEKGFLGAVLTRAHGFISAVQKTHDLGINPGGECRGAQLLDKMMATPMGRKHTQYADRLLSKQDIEEKLGGAAKMPEEL